MGNNHHFTIETTFTVKGIAMILLIIHHFFTPNSIVYMSNLSTSFDLKLGIFGKLCVAIFTVLSGYGLTKRCNDAGLNIEKYIIGKCFLLYRMFVFCFICFFLLGKITGYHFDGGILPFLDNLFLLSYTYCGAWWFMAPFMILMLSYPITYRCINKQRNVISDMLFVFMIWTFVAFCYPEIMQFNIIRNFSCSNKLWWIMYLTLQLYPAFLLGCVLFKHDILENILAYMNRLSWYKRILVAWFFILVVVCYRNSYGEAPETVMPEFLFAGILVICFSILAPLSYKVSTVLAFIGKQSSYMWLLHPLVLHWCIIFLKKSGFVLNGYFLLLMVICLSISLSIIVQKLYCSVFSNR